VLANSTPVPLATPDAAAPTLRLWLPPQFAPSPDTPGGKVLAAQLAAFEEAKGWHVEVRIKKAAGQGGLIDFLHTSLQAAPTVSPDVIALDTSMLTFAADAIQPLTSFTEGDVIDFYSFALQAVRSNNTFVALPFAADTLGFAYSTTAYALPPRTWSDLKPEAGVAALPLNDPTALVTLQQYVALGGALTDEAGQPTLEAAVLAQVLRDYQQMQVAGMWPVESASMSNVDESWIIYRESRASGAAAFFGAYLADRRRVAATAFAPLPTHTGARAAFSRQWNYALLTSDPARQAIALELMLWLTAPENLGEWSLAASVLPARSQALSEWSDFSLASAAEQLLTVAQPEPSQTVLVVVGPPVTAAVQSVLNGQASPEMAALAAATTVAGR
jgi:ABC-type glycerol-3-phosphate transport system substrate-binding protein